MSDMVDFEKLDAGLNKLRGYDLEEAEAAERAAGNNYVNLSFSKSFQARLAAKALEMNVHDLRELPLKEYDAACQRVFLFFFGVSSATTP